MCAEGKGKPNLWVFWGAVFAVGLTCYIAGMTRGVHGTYQNMEKREIVTVICDAEGRVWRVKQDGDVKLIRDAEGKVTE